MSSFLSKRNPALIEEMDKDDCDHRLLENTYKQFPLINRLLSQWHRTYRNEILPLVSRGRSYTLLDIGFGGGDVPINLAKWAEKDGIELNITAIDTDRRAYKYAHSYYSNGLVTWRCTSTRELLLNGEQFDFVISNHLLHHLHDNDVLTLLEEAKALCQRKVIFSDIERSKVGYTLFSIFSRLIFSHSFITNDGLISIKRSFTQPELRALVPDDWIVKHRFPFRLLLTHEKS